MVGSGTGKSTVSNGICEKDDNYIKIESDEYKTVPKMIKKQKNVSLNKSVIFDAIEQSKKGTGMYKSFLKRITM